MLKGEAHHMFVGASGIARVVQRTVELMKEHDTDDVAPFGGIDVPTLQRYLNFHCSVSLDLFGAETSTNAANYFAAGLKGRFREEQRDDDHRLHGATRDVPAVVDGTAATREAPALAALNETLREDYVADCAKGVERWNRTLADVGAELRLPHVGFNRAVGVFRDHHVTPDGRLVDDSTWAAAVDDWLPTDRDRAHVESLMRGITEPGRMAGWLAPPANGIHAKPVDYEYVKVCGGRSPDPGRSRDRRIRPRTPVGPRRARCSGQELGLLGRELLLGDHTLVAQRGELRQLVGRAGPAGHGSADRGLADVVVHRGTLLLGLADVPLRHVGAVDDQVHEHTEERDDDDEDRPQGLAPSAHLVVAEDVGEDAEQQEQPGDPEEKPEHRPEQVHQRVVVGDHRSSM
jgi:hypothetical protein